MPTKLAFNESILKFDINIAPGNSKSNLGNILIRKTILWEISLWFTTNSILVKDIILQNKISKISTWIY